MAIEEGAVGHASISANVADFVSFEWVDRQDAQLQSVLAPQSLNLLGNTVPNKIKHACLGEILRKRPAVALARKVTAKTIPQNYMNGMPLAHTLSM
jgi:hypothetical protein